MAVGNGSSACICHVLAVFRFKKGSYSFIVDGPFYLSASYYRTVPLAWHRLVLPAALTKLPGAKVRRSKRWVKPADSAGWRA